MEINTFNTTEGLIDLHIHSDYSYCDREYMLTGVKPLDLLKEIKDFSDKFDCSMVFSLTDHDNILGAKEIREKINSNLSEYKKVTFINGIELSVSSKSIGIYKKLAREFDTSNVKSSVILDDIHLLGYNYDENDPVLNYYSEINSLDFYKSFIHNNTTYPYGAIFIAGKNFLKNNNIRIPLREFLDLKVETGPRETKTFIRNVNNFCSFCSNTLFIDANIIKKMKSFLLNIENKQLYKNITINPDNVIKNSKIDVMEAMSLIENAGGVSVLPHPNIIKLNSKYIALFGKKDDYGFIAEKIKGNTNEETLKRKIANQTQAKEKLLDFILNKLVNDAYDPITGEKLNGLIGIEVLHKSNIFSGYFSALTDLVKKYKLYATGGSDKHGCLNKKIISIGQVMPLYLENHFKSPDKKRSVFSIYNCTFIDDIIQGNKLERKKNNDNIELLVRTRKKQAIFKYNDLKRFVETYARSNTYGILKRDMRYDRNLVTKINKKRNIKLKINFRTIEV